MNPLPEVFTGVFGLILLVFAVALAIYWLLFPMMVCRRLDKISKSLATLEKNASDHALVQRNFFSDVREVMPQKQPRD